jgi:hypothetical protein
MQQGSLQSMLHSVPAACLVGALALLLGGCAAMFKLSPNPVSHPETMPIGGLEATVIDTTEALVVVTGWKTIHQELIFNVFVLNKSPERQSLWIEQAQLHFVDEKGVRQSQRFEDPKTYRQRLEDQQVLAEILLFISGGFFHVHPEWQAGGSHRHNRYGFHHHPEHVWQSSETTLDGLERAGYLDQHKQSGGDYLARYRSAANRLLSSVTLGPGRSTEGLMVTPFSPAAEYELDLVVGAQHYHFNFRPIVN